MMVMSSKTYLQYVAIPALAFFVSALVSYNVMPEKTPQHNSTVSGSSGDLVCTSSCKVKDQ
jgi:hypothetical protein